MLLCTDEHVIEAGIIAILMVPIIRPSWNFALCAAHADRYINRPLQHPGNGTSHD